MTLDELRRDLKADFPARVILDPESGDVRVLLHGNIDWGLKLRGQAARLRCDRLVVVAPEGLESPFDTNGYLLLEVPSALPVLGTERAE